jgi:hypothetical protein
MMIFAIFSFIVWPSVGKNFFTSSEEYIKGLQRSEYLGCLLKGVCVAFTRKNAPMRKPVHEVYDL